MSLFSGILFAKSGPDLVVERTIGQSEDDPILFRPVDVSWSMDGRAYVLNEGDGRVLVFSPQWEHLGSFAGLGDGPGNLNSPSMLRVLGNEVWVKTPVGVDVFDLDGSSLGHKAIPLHVTSFELYGSTLFGTSSSIRGAGVRLGSDGAVAEYFGPRQPEGSSLLDLVRRMNWKILVDENGRLSLLDRYQGAVYLADRAGSDFQPEGLGLGRGAQLGAATFKLAICDAIVDPSGGFWVTTYEDRKSKRFLFHFDVHWKLDGQYSYPNEIWPGLVRISPNNKICLIEEQSSIIYICANPRIE